MALIDITHVFDENTPIYPGDFKTLLVKHKTTEKDYYCAYELHTALHTGTHIDIPMHLIDDDRMVKDFQAGDFIGNGVVLDVRDEECISMKPEYNVLVKEKDIVLLYTGYDKYYHEPKYFSDHPVVGDELAHFLLSKNIKMLGMDMPAPDKPPFVFHKDLLRNGVFVLENLTNLGALLNLREFEVFALPLKISAEASLVRAVCREITPAI